MELIIVFIAYVVFFYSFYKIMFWMRGKIKKKELLDIMELYFLAHIFKVDTKIISMDKLTNIVCICNSIIFSIVLTVTSLIDNFILRMLLMFILLFPLIYIMYYIVSKILKRKGKDKNV